MMLSVGIGGIRVTGSYSETSVICRFKLFSFQTQQCVQFSSNESLPGALLEVDTFPAIFTSPLPIVELVLAQRLRDCRPHASYKREGGTISTSRVSSGKDGKFSSEFHKRLPETKVARVRLSRLPKKRNICNDLWSAFWDIPEIINIVPFVNETKITKNATCKGYAFVDFRYDEDAVRFVERFSGQEINFGNVLKRIKCAVITTSLYSASKTKYDHFESVDAEYSASEGTDLGSFDEALHGRASPTTEVDQGCNKLVRIPKGVDGRWEKSSGDKGKHVCVPEILSNEEVKNFNRSDGYSSHGHVEDNQCSVFSFDDDGDDDDDDTNGLSVLWEDDDDDDDDYEEEELDIGSLLFNVDEGSSSVQAHSQAPKKTKKSKKKKVKKRR